MNMTNYHVTAENDNRDKIPFISISVSDIIQIIFGLPSEVLVALPTVTKALLLHHEQGINLMGDNYELDILLFQVYCP